MFWIFSGGSCLPRILRLIAFHRRAPGAVVFSDFSQDNVLAIAPVPLHLPDGPQHLANDVGIRGKTGVFGVVRVGGLEPQPGRSAVAGHKFDALDHQSVAVPEHEHLAGGGNSPGGIDRQTVAV